MYLAKQVNKRNKEPDVRATYPFELVHTDLAGPIHPIAKVGFKYVISFTDDFSGCLFTYFLKQKSDDNGVKYLSKEFRETLIKNCINHELTSPYSPHQNGTAERNWCTLFDMARSMLLEANLPKYLWTYAVMNATHI